ncbi:MAG: hypothetical protein ACI8UR_001113 [Natronomonas sp.]|jgi:hypothetical protein
MASFPDSVGVVSECLQSDGFGFGFRFFTA